MQSEAVSVCAQWLDEDVLPGFKATFERYLLQVEALSNEFIKLIAEALHLSPSLMDQFFKDNIHGAYMN